MAFERCFAKTRSTEVQAQTAEIFFWPVNALCEISDQCRVRRVLTNGIP